MVKVYTDEARSATTDDRPGFLQMVEDIKSGRVKADLLLVHKLDRFARNRYDSAFYKRELRRAGARVESVLEQLDDSPESILMESVIEGMAEYYSRNLAREVMKGDERNGAARKTQRGQAAAGL
ncbi:MAG: recombinase family protein [Peptococcaceae bacterium MAG4]|nr:recombinase family protein [Peptococcaceae bacterium MAG4]